MEKQRKTYLIRMVFLQIGLLVSWVLGQMEIISPLVKGILILFFVGGIFHSIYKLVPASRNIFLVIYLIVVLIMTWLLILPSLV